MTSLIKALSLSLCRNIKLKRERKGNLYKLFTCYFNTTRVIYYVFKFEHVNTFVFQKSYFSPFDNDSYQVGALLRTIGKVHLHRYNFGVMQIMRFGVMRRYVQISAIIYAEHTD